MPATPFQIVLRRTGAVLAVLLVPVAVILLMQTASGPSALAAAPHVAPQVTGSVTPATATPTQCIGATWRQVASPNGTGYASTLYGVSALSTNDVWAVGETHGPGAHTTLIEHWNGSSWSIATDFPGDLRGVAAIGPNDVWAVGNLSGAPNVGLTIHWDGTAWTSVPNPGGQFLYAVAGTASDDVWAVGSAALEATAWHWDGTQWNAVPLPSVNNGWLFGVTALSADNVWAVGGENRSQRTLVFHWDGTAWSRVDSPNPGTSNVLESISAVGPYDIWAVGWYMVAPDDEVWMSVHWDGASWTFVPVGGPADNPNSLGKLLHGVSAVSTNDVWAVGQEYEDWYGHTNTVTFHWDGNGWMRVVSASPSTKNLAYAIDMLSPGTGWFVGSAGVDTYYPNTLTERLGPLCVSPTPAPPTSTPGGPTATPRTPTPTACVPGSDVVFTGSIDEDDPVMLARVADENPPGNCVLQVQCEAFETTPRNYDSYILENTSGSETCVTVQLSTPSCGGFFAVQSAAYLGSFDPENLCLNFLSDIGGSPYEGQKSYSFNVPAHSTFVVVVNAIEEGFGCPQYTLTVQGLPNPGCATATNTPTRTITSTRTPTRTRTATRTPAVVATNTPADTGTPAPTNTPGTPTPTPCGALVINGAIDSADPTQTGRLFRNGIASECDAPNDCTLFDTSPRHYDVYSFTNDRDVTVCVTVELDAPTCTSSAVYSVAYLNAFDPANVCLNSIGDPGASPVLGPVSYSFDVPPNSTFFVTVHEVTPDGGCGGYTLTLTGLGNESCASPTAMPATETAIPQPTDTPIGPLCNIGFSDVPPGSTFYGYIRCLACEGIISGYPDGSFRPNASVTRGQLAKMISNAAGYNDPVSSRTFQDVPEGSTFYVYVERISARGIVGGYACGSEGEPCVPPANLPYYRPSATATRGQIAKLTTVSMGLRPAQTDQMFEDVPTGNAFYDYVNLLAAHQMVAGYPCGGAGEPCEPGSMPYFRPSNKATRGQVSKIISSGFYPECTGLR